MGRGGTSRRRSGKGNRHTRPTREPARSGAVSPTIVAPPSTANLFSILLIIGAGLVAFAPSLDNEFVQWDDVDNLVENEHIHSFSSDNLHWMLRSDLIGVWQPLTWFITAFEYQLFGGENLSSFRRGLQYSSLFFHVMASILCYFITVHLLGRAMPRVAEQSPTAMVIGATLAAVLFTVHPLRAEAVAWASGQPYLLAANGCLASLLCYLRAVRSGRRRWHVLAIVFLVASLLCKSIAIPLVAVFLLLDVYPLRRIGGPNCPGRPILGSVLIEKIPYLIPTLAAIVMATWANLATPDYQPDPPLVKSLIISFSLVFYVVSTFVPVGIAPYYARPHPIGDIVSDPWFLAAVAGVFVVTIVAIAVRRRHPWLLCVWIGYCLFVAPVAGFVLHGGQLAADRYTYLSCIGWAILVGGVAAKLWARSRQRNRQRIIRIPLILIGTTVVIGLCYQTRSYCRVWRDSISLFTAMVERNPNWPNGHYHLARQYRRRNNIESAVRSYRRAVEIYPDYPEANVNLGILLQSQGALSEAEDHYQRALRGRPRFHMAHYNLGCLLFQRGAYLEAVYHFKEAEADAKVNRPSLLPKIRQRLSELQDYDVGGR